MSDIKVVEKKSVEKKVIKVEKSDVVLNKFEVTRLLSARAYELASGATPKVDIGEEVLLGRDYIEVAKRELDEGVLDLEVYHNK